MRAESRGMCPQRAWATVSMALVVAALAGCTLLRTQGPATTFAGPQARSIVFTSGFDGTPAIDRVVYRDPSEYEEYLRVAGAARAESVLVIANGRETALEFSAYALRPLTERWRFTRDGAAIADWSGTRLLRIEDRVLRYALFVQAGDRAERACVAFLRAWDAPPDDPRHRPGRAAFGYYCAAAGRGLDEDAARTVLEGLVFRDIDPERVYYGAPRERDPAALALVRSDPDAAYGLADFPLGFSRYYNVGGDGERFD